MISRRQWVSTAAAAASVAALPVLAQTPPLAKLKFTLDWARQGPNAYTDLGKEKGFFREVGIDVTIDRGFGSGRVPTDIAAGTYDMGQGDIPEVEPVIVFKSFLTYKFYSYIKVLSVLIFMIISQISTASILKAHLWPQNIILAHIYFF